VKYAKDFSSQMLFYSKNFNFLPDINWFIRVFLIT
jgi:hypothetical protein